MFTSSWKVTSTWSQTQKSNVSICSQPDLNCQCATACALYPNHKRDSNDACSLWNQKRHSFGRKLKSTTQATVRMITKHHSAHRCACDTQPMVRIHKMHVRLVTKSDSIVPTPIRSYHDKTCWRATIPTSQPTQEWFARCMLSSSQQDTATWSHPRK